MKKYTKSNCDCWYCGQLAQNQHKDHAYCNDCDRKMMAKFGGFIIGCPVCYNKDVILETPNSGDPTILESKATEAKGCVY